MNSTDHDSKSHSNELFESLFKNAPARSRPPEADEARIRATLHGEWELMNRRRRRFRFTAAIATAASVVLAVAMFAGVSNKPDSHEPVLTLASVVKQSGQVMVGTSQTPTPMQALQTGETFKSGSVIATAFDARMAMRWLDGASIRLDTNTRVVLVSETDIELLGGRIYIDSHDDSPGNSENRLGIITPLGRVQHLGTQYMAQLASGSLIVSVRQGSVAMTRDHEKSVAAAGQQINVSRHGNIATEPILTYGENWQWIEQISPGFVLDGRSLADFLNWVSRESGTSLEYASVAAETLALETVMRGTVELQPMRALDLMLQTSDLVAEVHNGVIKIDAKLGRP